MEAIYAAHGGQALDLEIINAAPGNSSKVYGNDARFADVHFISVGADATNVAQGAAVHVQGVTTDGVAEGAAAQDNANAINKLVLGDKASSVAGSYVGQTLRVYADGTSAAPSLANAKPLTGSNSPHGPVGYKDYVITAYNNGQKAVTLGVADELPWGNSKTANDGADYGGANKFSASYEILPGVKVTGTNANATAKVLVLSGRLHVPQL